MDTNLAQLYLQTSEPLDNSIRNQIDEEILRHYENPESFFEILTILYTPDANIVIKSNAAIGLKKVIQKHLNFLLTDLQSNNEQSALNNLLQVLHAENNQMISLYIITSLLPVFRSIGDSWEQLTNLFTALFDSTDPNNINKGLQLMSDFLPYASSEFVSAHLSTIVNFIQSALSSADQDILIHGIQLLSSLLQTEIPISEFSDNLFEIFKRTIDIFHKFLVDNDSKRGTDASISIAQILKCNPLFAPPSEIYQLLFQVLSDSSISIEAHHLPLYPIGKLLKYYGKELQGFFPQSIGAFLTVSALQFNDAGYDSLDGSTSIISLFTYMVESIDDPSEFINIILQNVCSSNNIAESFASICALIGLVESSCQQVELYCQRLIEYCINRAELGSITLTQAILSLIYELIKEQSESMTEYASHLCNFLFQLYQAHQDETIIQQSLDNIKFIFYNFDLERSFVIEYVPKLVQAYQEASPNLKPYFMQCLSGSILTCQEDSAIFSDQLIPIIIEGAQSTSEYDIDNRAYSIEALGDFLAFIPEKCANIYEGSIKLILTASTEEHFLLRSSGLRSLINIIKYSEGNLPINFTSYAIETAKKAMSLEIPESGSIYAHDDSSYSIVDIIVDGFRLFRFLLKYRKEDCCSHLNIFPNLFKSSMRSRAPIKIIALKTAACINPDIIDIFDSIYKLIINPSGDNDDEENYYIDDDDIVSTAFSTLKKIVLRYENKRIDLNLGRFLEVAFAGIAHKLPCQNESFEYNKKITKSLTEFLITCIERKFELFPADIFIHTLSEVINNIDEKEAFKLLEVLSIYIEKGAPVNDDIMLFGLNKLPLCDFSHSEEPIYFVKSLVAHQPQFLEDKIEQIIPFLFQRLSTEPVPLKYYWATIVSIISLLLALILSDKFNKFINFDQCIALILSKLPAKEEFESALFIYNSIMHLIKFRSKEMSQFIPEILRVFVQTLALNQKHFEKLDFDLNTIQSMINSVKSIFQNYPQLQEQVPAMLNNDKIKLDHFVSNVKKFEQL